MVIAFTEEQKKEIESRGMTVIEVKRTLYKARDFFCELWDKIKSIINGLPMEEIRKMLENRTEEKIAGIEYRDDRHYTPPSLMIKENG